ncbi:hypothetical protein IW261DRAFT_1570336 [Armillaria novae-zelandiae]|uniref:DNA helicase n=1 Tax=Armillaria novae-zelandiae TaxID=153914 RepID=A0AA39NW35_9AGAR|nr:hypothetical protein IW261DRAFT_1570336 [Armillaria novae-zelandiae]
MSRKAMVEVKEHLHSVDYVFLDEVSMLSCANMYRISSRLSLILNNGDVLFRGMNMIFAGDFTQLPPPMGGKSASLYGLCNGMFASNKRSQEMAMGAIHFAEETGQELCVFYCDDKLSGAESTEQAAWGQGAKSPVCFISDRLRQTLWSAVPSSSNKQIPPTLSICKGQEGTVYSWTSSVMAHSKPVLDVIFVQLVNPPADMDIASLLCNVVPVVEIAINFAMTDFASQGKTQLFNLNNCRTHQAYYTALSRSATAVGTLILPALGQKNGSPIDPSKIQAGCSGCLCQEFRKLEMLDDITNPVGDAYTPPNMDQGLMWSSVWSFEMEDATHVIWAKDFITHKPFPPVEPVSTTSPTNFMTLDTVQPGAAVMDRPAPLVASTTHSRLTGLPNTTRIGSVGAASRMHKFTPMKPSEKWKGWASDTFDQRHIAPDNWSNNSCAYDTVTFVLYNTWNADQDGIGADFAELGNRWMDLSTAAFRKFTLGEYMLEEVWDYLRHSLSREYPGEFVFGANTSVEALTMRMFRSNGIFSVLDKVCGSAHATPVSSQQCCVVMLHSTAPLQWNTLQQFLDNTLLVLSCHAHCDTCDAPLCKCTTYNIAPPLLCMAIAFNDVAPGLSIRLTTSIGITEYCLAGIVYYGELHFTARYIDSDLIVWFNDGMVQH